MPVEKFVDSPEPQNPHAEIWRYVEFWKLQDLIRTRKLYFRRSDLLSDEQEGLPPEDYVGVLGLNKYIVGDADQIAHHLGYLAQIRQSFYVNCWHMHETEKAGMWRQYGKDGVALVSRYDLLKGSLDRLPDKVMLGTIRYGTAHLNGWNVIQFMTTKRFKYSAEREVRAMIWKLDSNDGLSRHIDKKGKPQRRPVYEPPIGLPEFLCKEIDPTKLISEIVVSPTAPADRKAEIESLLSENGINIEVRQSALKSDLIEIPSEDDLRQYS